VVVAPKAQPLFLVFLRTLFASFLSLLFVFFATLFLAPDKEGLMSQKEIALCFKDWKLKETKGV
jgi:hypothetical protein